MKYEYDQSAAPSHTIALWHNGCHFLKKIAVRKCSTLKIDFSANFNMIFFGGGSVNTPKIGKRKNNVTNINLRECKTKKKHEGGVCYGQNGS